MSSVYSASMLYDVIIRLEYGILIVPIIPYLTQLPLICYKYCQKENLFIYRKLFPNENEDSSARSSVSMKKRE